MFPNLIKQKILVLIFTWLLLLYLPQDWCFALDNSAAKKVENNAPAPVQTRPLLDTTTIPAEKVNKFVQAYLQVWQLISQRQGELQAAETELESLRIEQDVEAKASAIITQSGLTKQEYLQLLGLANVDPEFGERVAMQLQEARQ
ncbi:DUF4168 domain-containing protein [Aliterella atlantica]|uniref:DUF4168 domain-containing protein n=1 Tax=Aliterella atlantica TaxID=1827278 RepID=UPI0009E1F598|nr:DUF4168 domain-containing protein [Aliterella atlantica]